MPSRWTAAAVPVVVVAAMASVMVCQFSEVSGMVFSPEPGKFSWIAWSSWSDDLTGEDDVGTMHNSAGGDAAESAGELDGRGGDGALADADGDDFAGVPLLVLGLELPGGGGHGAGDLVGEIDAGLLREAERGGVFGDGVDAEAVREGVVEGVAGLGDGVVDVDHAVVFVAGEEVAVEGGAAVAHATCMVLGDVFLESGDGHDDLEGGAGGESAPGWLC